MTPPETRRAEMSQTTVTARAWIDRQDARPCWAFRLTNADDSSCQEDDALEVPLEATVEMVVAEVARHVAARGYLLAGNVEW